MLGKDPNGSRVQTLEAASESSAPAWQYLPQAAQQLRQTLLAAARERLGLVTTEVDCT
ncbi:hypothetical protein [Streptomyces sp. R41]|uniref:Uncharacterized protein n=1 Tax=Streptomyces sp. R41 TaxID=3238632 RepID=A0AB39R5T1_9ACTN